MYNTTRVDVANALEKLLQQVLHLSCREGTLLNEEVKEITMHQGQGHRATLCLKVQHRQYVLMAQGSHDLCFGVQQLQGFGGPGHLHRNHLLGNRVHRAIHRAECASRQGL